MILYCTARSVRDLAHSEDDTAETHSEPVVIKIIEPRLEPIIMKVLLLWLSYFAFSRPTDSEATSLYHLPIAVNPKDGKVQVLASVS